MLLSRGVRQDISLRVARDNYWRRRLWLVQLEGRIQRTDSGLAWLMRVKRIPNGG